MVVSLQVCFKEPALEGAEVYEISNVAEAMAVENQSAPNADNFNGMNLTPVADGVRQAIGIQTENTISDSADVAHMNLQCAGGMLGELCGQISKAANELSSECQASPHRQQPEIIVANPEPELNQYQPDYTMNTSNPGMGM
jgi:hypothetical protein